MIRIPNRILTILPLAIVLTVGLSCSEDDNGTDPQNSPPTITSVTADPDTIYEGGGLTKITVVAQDPDDDPLDYMWDARNLSDAGGQDNEVLFQSCCDIDEPTTGVVYSTVDDSRGGQAHDSVEVTILPLPER
jgi:hypothetical protein